LGYMLGVFWILLGDLKKNLLVVFQNIYVVNVMINSF
jgi:hypothetical protein